MSVESSIHISSVALSVDQKSRKTIDHIVLQTRPRDFKKEIPGQLSHGKKYKEVLDSPLELSAQDELSVSMQYQTRYWWFGRNRITIAMKQGEIVKEAREDAQRNRSYVKLHRNILVTIDMSRDSTAATVSPYDLPPTTIEILRICPRFRLLIIGNTGVGKSSLISKVFGVKGVDVSKSSRGKAEIDREFVAAKNTLFVLHDSLGLEAAEGDNLAKVKNFVRDRRQKQDPKDRLHAVWVCLQVPYAKGRLLEAGMEEFLRERKKILGNIPIVVILTKLDLLDNRLLETMRTEGIVLKSIQEAKSLLEPRRAEFLEEHCARLLVRDAGSDIPHIAVSTIPGYNLETTIPELVKKTTSEIERYIKADPSYGVMSEQSRKERKAPLYTAGMTQRASIEANVDLTIAIGRMKYWVNLDASFTFSPENVKQHLFVIHRDIIQVWNFDDPEMALQDDKFKEALLDTSNFGVGDVPGGGPFPESEASIISVLGPLINKSASVVVALPVAGTSTLASFCDQIYQSRSIAKPFITYIADLIYVMRILFILAPYGSVTARDVALAFDIYTKSPYRSRVHLEVNETLPEGPNTVVKKIEALIGRFKFTDEEMLRLRSQIPVPPAASQDAFARS